MAIDDDGDPPDLVASQQLQAFINGQVFVDSAASDIASSLSHLACWCVQTGSPVRTLTEACGRPM